LGSSGDAVLTLNDQAVQGLSGMLGNAHVDALVCQRGLASVAWQIDPQLMNKLHKTNSEWLSDCQNL